jgi:NAD(P)-dependent dehydrogenase (short-subunit alcohol dehydrogenase family)
MSTALQGKRIVILGGTSGIGLATANAAEREGALVVVASSRKPRVDQGAGQLVEPGLSARVPQFGQVKIAALDPK